MGLCVGGGCCMLSEVRHHHSTELWSCFTDSLVSGVHLRWMAQGNPQFGEPILASQRGVMAGLWVQVERVYVQGGSMYRCDSIYSGGSMYWVRCMYRGG